MNDKNFYHSFLSRDWSIHIVDADPLVCESLSVLFRLEGYQTSFSMDAASFLASLDRRRPDAVILNLKLGLGSLRVQLPTFGENDINKHLSFSP